MIFFCFYRDKNCGSYSSLPLPDLTLRPPDLVEHLRDDRNKHVLNHPCEEEDHRDEVEGGLPGIQRVRGPVHDVHPAFLYSS